MRLKFVVAVASGAALVILLALSCGRPPSILFGCQPGNGDVNMNGKASDIGDAVLLTQYFIQGPVVFTIDKNYQIAASDVNGDCIAPALADLVYMVHLIVGDAKPVAKLIPVVATYKVDTSVISVDIPVVKAHIIVEGRAKATLLVDNIRISTGYDTLQNVTRILVYSLDMKQTFTGSFLRANSDLLAIDFATYDGVPVIVKRHF
jgi:hypothetical protein